MSEPGGVPAETLGWIGALIALFGGPPAIAKAVKWWAARAEKRRKDRAAGNREWEAKLKAWQAQIETEREATLAECRRHCAEATSHVEKMRVVILLIVPEIERHAPASPTLKRAKLLLAELAEILPLPLDLPTDMRAQIDPDMRAQVSLIDQQTR